MIQPQPQQVAMADDTSKEKIDVCKASSIDCQTDHLEEKAPVRNHITPNEIQQQFSLLQNLSGEQMVILNKKVVKKLDWRMMPCITMMFLMSYVYPKQWVRAWCGMLKVRIVTLTGSTSQTPGWRAYRATSA